MPWPKGRPQSKEANSKRSKAMFAKQSPKERFWAKVRKSDGCWLWTGALNNKGYGDFHLGSGSSHLCAHVFSYMLNCGSIPENLEVMHTCDIPACVRPDHLIIGTHRENMQDMARKGRHGKQDGKVAIR